MSVAGSPCWIAQEACKADCLLEGTTVVREASGAGELAAKQATLTLQVQPRATLQANALQGQAQDAFCGSLERLPADFTARGSCTAPDSAATLAAQQNGLKAMPLQLDSAVSGCTAEAAFNRSCSLSTPTCMEQKHNAAPQQLQGDTMQHAGSGSTDASSSPKSGSVNPSSVSPVAPGQSHANMTQQAGDGPASQHQGPHQGQQLSKQATAGGAKQDPSNMPIAKFDPSLVAAVKCAADILQTDDGWSKEEAAATIAALTAKFQHSKSRSAAAAAASAGRAAADAGLAQCMLGQPGGSVGSWLPQNSQSSGGRPGSLPSLLPTRQPSRLHPFLPSLGKPTVSAGTGLGAVSSKLGDAGTANGLLGPTLGASAGLGVLPSMNGLSRAHSIPGWGAGNLKTSLSAGQDISGPLGAAAAAAARLAAGRDNSLHVACSVGYLGLRASSQQPQNSGGAGGLGAYGAACSSSTGAPAGSTGAVEAQDAMPVAAEQAGDGTTAVSKGLELAPEGVAGTTAGETGFGRKPSATSSGLCSVMEPRQQTDDPAAGAATPAAEDAHQQEQPQPQRQQPAGNSSRDAAVVAAAAASAAAVQAALQQEEQQQQQQQLADAQPDQQQAAAVAAALKLPENHIVTNSVINALNQSGGLQEHGASGQPQLPVALMALLQSGQPQALPLMSALLRSGNLRPAVAESLKARLAGYLQQQQGQQPGGGAGKEATAGEAGAAAAVTDQQMLDEQQQQADAAMQHALQQQQQQNMAYMLQQQTDMQFFMQQQAQQQQRYEQMQADTPADSDSRSVESIAAATSHAAADAAVEPVGRRKRGRQPSAKAAAIIAAKEDEQHQPSKRQARASAAAKQEAAAAAAVSAPAPQVVQKGRRGRPPKASKAAAAAAAKAAEEAAAANEELQGAWTPDGVDSVYPGSVDPAAAAAAVAAPEQLQQQHSLHQALNGNSSLGANVHASQQQQQHLQAQVQQQQQVIDSQQAAAAAAQQQFEQQLQQLPPINTGAPMAAAADPSGSNAQQLLQQLQGLPPAAAQQVAKIAQQLPPGLPQHMRQALLSWAVNTVTQKIGLGDDAAAAAAAQPQLQQQASNAAMAGAMWGSAAGTAAAPTAAPEQPQQQPKITAAGAPAMWGNPASAAPAAADPLSQAQQQQRSGVTAAGAAPALWGAAAAPGAQLDPAAAAATPATALPVDMQQQHVQQPPTAGDDNRDMMSGLLAAAHQHPGLRNMNQQDREAFLRRLLQQRNARLFAQGNAQQQSQQQQQLDPASAVAAPASADMWPPRVQAQQQSEQQAAGRTTAAAAAAAAASLPMGMDMSWVQQQLDPAALAAQAVSQAPGTVQGLQTQGLQHTGSLPLPGSTPAAAAAAGSGGALGALGANLRHAATMPEALGDVTVATAAAAANFGSMHPGAAAGANNHAAAATAVAAAAMERPQYMQSLEYQLQLHGMSKKRLLELMREVGPVAALQSIGMHHSALQGHQGAQQPSAAAAQAAQAADPAAAAAMPAAYDILQQQHSLQQQQHAQQQQQQMMVNQRLQQQLAGLSGAGDSMYGQQQQQQQPSWMMNGSSTVNTMSQYGNFDMSGLFGPAAHMGSNYGGTVHGYGTANPMNPNNIHGMHDAGQSMLGGASTFADFVNQQTGGTHNSMMPSFPASYDPAAAAAAPVSAAAAAASRLQMAGAGMHSSMAGSAAAAAAALNAASAGMHGAAGAAANWMAGAGAAAGYSAGLGHMADNYNSNTAALDPPVLVLPDPAGQTPLSGAAARTGIPQQHGQQSAMSADLPGSLLNMPNHGEDLLGTLGLDMGDVDALLGNLDTGGMGLAADGGLGFGPGEHITQSMQDVWSNCRTG